MAELDSFWSLRGGADAVGLLERGEEPTYRYRFID